VLTPHTSTARDLEARGTAPPALSRWMHARFMDTMTHSMEMT